MTHQQESHQLIFQIINCSETIARRLAQLEAILRDFNLETSVTEQLFRRGVDISIHSGAQI